MAPVRLEREKLYIQVWRRPIGYLARDLGITSARLRQVCKMMAIPVPDTGHWAAVRAHTAGTPVPLPDCDVPLFITVDGSPREGLAEWVKRTAPHTPVARSVTLSHVVRVDQSAKPRMVPLKVWATLLLGEHAPHNNTLLRWVHEGRIQPQPKKIGRKWYVPPNADYIGD